jgi:hypothetical protein
MVKNPEILQKFENELAGRLQNSFAQRLALFESMLEYRNTIQKNIDPLAGLKEKLEIVKRLHQC